MKLSTAQTRAYEALRASPTGKISSGDGSRIARVTMEALTRKGLVEMERTATDHRRQHRDGRSSTYVTISWSAELIPEHPGADELAELDLIIANGEGILRPDRREHAAAYIARTAPLVAMEGSPAAAEAYSVCRAYREALEWPVARLLDQVMMLRHMTGQNPLPGGIPAQSTGERTDVWRLTAKTGGPRPGKELGRVRASTQNAAAIAGNSLLNARGGYQMARLGSLELGRWVEDFRARGIVLRLEATDDGYRVSQVADDRTLVIRADAAQAKRDALADLTALYSTFGPAPELIHAD